MISGGRLQRTARRLIASASRDSLGIRTDSWSDGLSFRVDLREQSATEQGYADGVAVVRSLELRCRWPDIARVGLTAVDRISVRGRTLRINTIRNLDDADRVAVIDCTEVN
jgi:head-tail adaptor